MKNTEFSLNWLNSMTTYSVIAFWLHSRRKLTRLACLLRFFGSSCNSKVSFTVQFTYKFRSSYINLMVSSRSVQMSQIALLYPLDFISSIWLRLSSLRFVGLSSVLSIQNDFSPVNWTKISFFTSIYIVSWIEVGVIESDQPQNASNTNLLRLLHRFRAHLRCL